MGVPSPINGPIASPMLKLKNPMSPELPLQAVQELDDASQACDLLPPSSVDLQSSCGRIVQPLKPTRAWADAKDSDASDCDEHSESSTGLPRADSNNSSESLESRSNGSVSKANADVSPDVAEVVKTISEPSAPTAGIDVLQEKGVMKADLASLMTYEAGFDGAGSLVQLLCRIYRDERAGMSVVPCMGDDVAADSEHEVFWCYVQPQQDGAALITPCTDAATCGVFVDASGASLECATEIVGAPAAPPAGSHTPVWVYGARWPFTVAPTTLILSNLPDDLLQEDFIEILDKEGYGGFYDFAYLPAGPEKGRNLGYAIVNLTRHEYGLALSALMNGRTSWCGAESSECQVTWSIPLQGITQIVEHFTDHEACKDSVPEEMRPTFFSGGWPQPFPLAQKK